MRKQWRTRPVLVLLLGSAIAAALVGGTETAFSQNGCTQVNGHLEVAVTDEGVGGRMIGGINGDYAYTFQGLVPSSNNPQVVYIEGRSSVETKKGTIRFIENSAAAAGSEAATNNATLMTVEGGTEAWQGSTGYIAIRGYFHNSTLTGEFDYRGEICKAS